MLAGFAAVARTPSEIMYPMDFHWRQRGAAAAARAIVFGPFELNVQRRELFEDSVPVAVGNRALDVLIALIEAGGDLVTKDEILRRVWPGMVVEENCLQFQISTLRKVLGRNRGFIRTVFGRGYRFIADTSNLAGNEAVPGARAVPSTDYQHNVWRTNLPAATLDIVGRQTQTSAITALIAAHRMVTLTGPGGIGKTHLAVDLARSLLPDFADGVWLAELGGVSDPACVLSAVATALGMASGEAASPAHLAASLAGKHVLLVLDDCAHVIDAAAQAAEICLRASSALRILATSREALRAEGECVYRIPPLDVPPACLRNEDLMRQHGAVQLFLARAQAAQPLVAMGARAAPLAAEICRRLDGIPLAIELAAARAATLGLEELTARLGDRFDLLIDGRRTAPVRHQTLRAALDWSYDRLTETERAVMQRLTPFAGRFSMDEACNVVACGDIPETVVVQCVTRLVDKSLLEAHMAERLIRYSLLETMRIYACEKFAARGAGAQAAPRHAALLDNPARERMR